MVQSLIEAFGTLAMWQWLSISALAELSLGAHKTVPSTAFIGMTSNLMPIQFRVNSKILLGDIYLV
jgi:hypothetical protein